MILAEKCVEIFRDHLDSALNDVIDFGIVFRIEGPGVENDKLIFVNTEVLVQNCPWSSGDIDIDSALNLKVVEKHHGGKGLKVSVVVLDRLFDNIFKGEVLALFD